MRLFELEQPAVGDILELELGDAIVEAVITAIEGDEIIAETDNYQGATLLAESYGRYYCSTDKKWKERKGPKQTRKSVSEGSKRDELERVKQQERERHEQETIEKRAKISRQIGQSNKDYHQRRKQEGVAEGQLDEAKIASTEEEDFFHKGKKVGSITKVTLKSGIIYYRASVGDSHTTGADTRQEALRDLKQLLRDNQGVAEAEYQGRDVKLGKPMQGDVKKFKVYVKDPSTGNVKKVNFGDPNMRIKKSNPKRRKSFRARHNCANPGPRTKARYWSCRKW